MIGLLWHWLKPDWLTKPMQIYTTENMTFLNVALMVRKLCALGKLNFFVAVDIVGCNSRLLDGAARGLFPSRDPEDWRKALRGLTESTPLDEGDEAAVMWLLGELSEGRLKEKRA